MSKENNIKYCPKIFVQISNFEYQLESRDSGGRTALHLACSEGATLSESLSKSLSLLSLKNTFHMLLIMTWAGRDKATRIFGKELFGMLFSLFQSWFFMFILKKIITDHDLSREGQGNQDIGEGAHWRQCQARKSMAIWSLAQRSSHLVHLSRIMHWKLGSKHNSLAIPLKVTFSTAVPHLL